MRFLTLQLIFFIFLTVLFIGNFLAQYINDGSIVIDSMIDIFILVCVCVRRIWNVVEIQINTGGGVEQAKKKKSWWKVDKKVWLVASFSNEIYASFFRRPKFQIFISILLNRFWMCFGFRIDLKQKISPKRTTDIQKKNEILKQEILTNNKLKKKNVR